MRLLDALWFPINLLQVVIGTVWSMGLIVIALIVRLVTGNTRIALGMARWPWAPGMLTLFGIRVAEVQGLDRVDFTRPHFFAANHQSLVDICILFKVLPVNLHFVVKDELSRVPFLAWYIRAMGMIFVDRSNRLRAQKSVERTARLVAGGKSVLIFPEGTRSLDGEVKRFKSGMLAAAAAGSVPVVPIALEGPQYRMRPGGIAIRPGPVRVAIGKPIETSEFDVGDRHELADVAQTEVARLLAGLRAG